MAELAPGIEKILRDLEAENSRLTRLGYEQARQISSQRLIIGELKSQLAALRVSAPSPTPNSALLAH